MKTRKLLAFLFTVCCGGQAAMADDSIVLRRSADRYALVGEGEAFTKGCTVTAEGSLTASVVRDRRRHKQWLVFRDRGGEEEAQCEVKFTVSVPRRTTMGDDLLAAK